MPVSFAAQDSSSDDDEDNLTQAQEETMQAARRQSFKQRRSLLIQRPNASAEYQETQRMLMEAQATSTYFRGFTEHMGVLCDSLSISPFESGDTILQEGEEGTWLGVLLVGALGVLQQTERGCNPTAW